MHRPLGFRTLLLLCSALAILLAALAAVQYRWATRVAAADAQREREHLATAASLFASGFNDAMFQVIEFMQKDGEAALKSGHSPAPPPKVVSQLFYVDISEQGAATVKRLAQDGTFVPADVPDWIASTRCAAGNVDRPPAIVFPIFQLQTINKTAAATVQILRKFRGGHCFVAQLDERYLREQFFPQLIRQSFGETSAHDYNFAVISRERPAAAIYGSPVQADLQKPFFTMSFRVPSPPPPPPKSGEQAPNHLMVQRLEFNMVATTSRVGLLFRDGIWELEVAHKGVPLADAFEQTRRRNLLFSLGVEGLLIAAIVFLVVAVRRTQWLAEQKMQFVAAVSHELRAPVSAIAMLSRNQADGLVAGADKVRQYGELMHQQSRRLNEMIEQTLQYAGIHSNLGRAAKTEIDLKRLIDETVEARRDEATRSGFQVEVNVASGLPAVHGDAKLLRIAIDNLLSNAEKYSNGSRWIGVSATYATTEREVQISVEDRGPGIAPSDQGEIFEPFYRGAAAVDSQIPGSGIGLSLVRSAVEAHRGTVTLVSQPGQGSTFTLHLPA